MQTQSGDNNAAVAGASDGRRKTAMLSAAAVFAAIGIAWSAYWVSHSRYLETTDDAYVAGNVVVVMPQIEGTVISIGVDDTDVVKAGDMLVALDTSDVRVALDQTKAQLAQTVRQVSSLYNTNASLAANVTLAQNALARAESDLDRRRQLADSGAVSFEELNHAQTAVRAAQADVQSASEKLSTNQAFTHNTTVENHPAVMQAAARVHEAYLALSRAQIPAAVGGQVAKRSVQVGQRVAPGTALMAIVPLDQVWVDANFKESQLAQMRIGQPVTLEADLYGSRVEYHGKVAGLGAGTGGAFSLLPAQNATGNWIKVVQRIPVRVQLDAAELRRYPLRIGLSMIATVDVQDKHGAQLTASPRLSPAYETAVYGKPDAEADALVRDIIQRNRGDVVASNRTAQNAMHANTRVLAAAR